MKRKLSEEFIREFAKSIQPVLRRHGIANKKTSLIEDIAFQLVSMLDGVTDPLLGAYRPLLVFKKGRTRIEAADGMHEFVFGVLQNDAFSDAEPPAEKDFLIASVVMKRLSGKKHEVNILNSMLRNKTYFAIPMEIALGIREVGEIGKKIDTELRIKKINKSQGKVAAIQIDFHKPGSKVKSTRIKYSGSGNVDELISVITSKIHGIYQMRGQTMGGALSRR